MAKRNSFKWRTVVGLILMYIAMWYNLEWVWGILFLMWVIPDLFSGVTYFIEPIAKKETPVLYWIVIFSWVLMSIYSFTFLFFPEWKYY